jgi:hypothetical protein
MVGTIEKRLSDLEDDVERFLAQLPGAPVRARLQALEARVHEGRITTATQIAEIEANIDKILQQLHNTPLTVG